MRIAILTSLVLATGCFNPKPYDQTGLGFYCNPTVDEQNPPSCPDGQTCVQQGNGDFRCVVAGVGPDMAGSSLIPKTGMYSGPHQDPMLDMVSMCPDASLEPNDSPSQAVPAPAPMPDAATPKITKMAICPTGPRPETGMHDVDFYMVDTTTLSTSSLTMMAEIFYDVSFGDLDVGIFDSNLMRLASDGSAVTNGCTAATIPAPNMSNPNANKFYVMVVGANNMDVNRYDIRIRTFSMAKQCPTASTDM
jgi:hypothetical protein